MISLAALCVVFSCCSQTCGMPRVKPGVMSKCSHFYITSSLPPDPPLEGMLGVLLTVASKKRTNIFVIVVSFVLSACLLQFLLVLYWNNLWHYISVKCNLTIFITLIICYYSRGGRKNSMVLQHQLSVYIMKNVHFNSNSRVHATLLTLWHYDIMRYCCSVRKSF